MRNFPQTSLQKYVLTVPEDKKDKEQLTKLGSQWVSLMAKNRIQYECEWFGVPIIQSAEDVLLMQEVIFKVKPDVILDIGIAHGGSAIFYSSMLELMGKGRVIAVDIDIRKHNRDVVEKHPFFDRIELIEGSSISEEMVNLIKSKIKPHETVLISLDSNHTRDHVLQELKMYWPMVPIGSYFIVFDTVTSDMAKTGAADASYIDNGPLEAVNIFLKENPHFEIDKSYNKLYLSHCRDGFLKRVG